MEDEEEKWNQKKQTLIDEISDKMIKGDLPTKIQAAREIRSMIRNRNSSVKLRAKFAGGGVIQPLVLMLYSQHHDAREASLLALLNLASRNERNKQQIVTCGAIPPLIDLLKFQNTTNLRELATAAILTLSTSAPNKPPITSAGAVPLLTQILSSGTVQARVDAVTTLHNLVSATSVPPTILDPYAATSAPPVILDPNAATSAPPVTLDPNAATSAPPVTLDPNAATSAPPIILDPNAAPPLINLLKECKKHSKFADKTTALIEIISKSPKGRIAITNSNNGILTLVETIEDGSLVSTEHAVGVLLELCLSSRSKYRELILDQGAIPGLLRLTVDGTHEAQHKARTLLDLLRDPGPKKRLNPLVLEKIVYDIAARVDGSEKTVETAKILLQDMVQRSLEP